MRFRRKVKIMKGVNLNFSKSGVSLSAGVRGASMTFGKNGTYLNTGIPGTGIYDRRRIDGGSTKNLSSTSDNPALNSPITVDISLDDKGSPVLKLTDVSTGMLITDEQILNKVRKTEKYKNHISDLILKRKENIDNGTSQFVNIYKQTPKLIIEKEINEELEKLKPEFYTILTYQIQKPNKYSIENELKTEAKKNINKLFFWKNSSLRNQYVLDNLDKRLEREISKWNENLAEFNKEQQRIKEENDLNFNLIFEETKLELQNILKGTTEFVNDRLEKLLNEIVLPLDFSVSFEYDENKQQLKIDLQLPNIESIPKEKANILASGKISIKEKNEKVVKKEYAFCVCGIALFLGGIFFNISTNINEIIISGYSISSSNVSGNDENVYLYSVKFKRLVFSSLNFENIDPTIAFSNFENNFKLSALFNFSPITPFQG